MTLLKPVKTIIDHFKFVFISYIDKELEILNCSLNLIKLI